MQNEEIIISHDSSEVINLRLKRKWHFVESLSRVIVYINGIETARINNGQEALIPVKPDSVIELDLQSPSMHNIYTVEITEIPRIEFGFSWLGSGSIFKYNNIRIRNHSGCRIMEKGKELSRLQKLDNKISFIAIGICLIFWVILQLSRCHIGIN